MVTVYILYLLNFTQHFLEITWGKNRLHSNPFAKIMACCYEKSKTGSHSAMI